MKQTKNIVEQGNKAHKDIPGNPSTATSCPCCCLTTGTVNKN